MHVLAAFAIALSKVVYLFKHQREYYRRFSDNSDNHF